MINENKNLHEEIKEMSLIRLKVEGLDRDPRLTDKNSSSNGKNLEFALKGLSYNLCYVCKKPYFAGRKDCGNDLGIDDDDPNVQFKPEECVCGKHANSSLISGVKDCPKHRKECIEYKC